MIERKSITADFLKYSNSIILSYIFYILINHFVLMQQEAKHLRTEIKNYLLRYKEKWNQKCDDNYIYICRKVDLQFNYLPPANSCPAENTAVYRLMPHWQLPTMCQLMSSNPRETADICQFFPVLWPSSWHHRVWNNPSLVQVTSPGSALLPASAQKGKVYSLLRALSWPWVCSHHSATTKTFIHY